jgi:RNA recognition motif-containing protein
MFVQVFVSGFPYSRTEDLREVFTPFGTVKTAFLATRPSGRPLGYGHVTFGSLSEAQHAVEALNGKVILGRRLRVFLSKSAAPAAGTTKPLIGTLL